MTIQSFADPPITMQKPSGRPVLRQKIPPIVVLPARLPAPLDNAIASGIFRRHHLHKVNFWLTFERAAEAPTAAPPIRMLCGSVCNGLSPCIGNEWGRALHQENKRNGRRNATGMFIR